MFKNFIKNYIFNNIMQDLKCSEDKEDDKFKNSFCNVLHSLSHQIAMAQVIFDHTQYDMDTDKLLNDNLDKMQEINNDTDITQIPMTQLLYEYVDFAEYKYRVLRRFITYDIGNYLSYHKLKISDSYKLDEIDKEKLEKSTAYWCYGGHCLTEDIIDIFRSYNMFSKVVYRKLYDPNEQQLKCLISNSDKKQTCSVYEYMFTKKILLYEMFIISNQISNIIKDVLGKKDYILNHFSYLKDQPQSAESHEETDDSCLYKSEVSNHDDDAGDSNNELLFKSKLQLEESTIPAYQKFDLSTTVEFDNEDVSELNKLYEDNEQDEILNYQTIFKAFILMDSDLKMHEALQKKILPYLAEHMDKKRLELNLINIECTNLYILTEELQLQIKTLQEQHKQELEKQLAAKDKQIAVKEQQIAQLISAISALSNKK